MGEGTQNDEHRVLAGGALDTTSELCSGSSVARVAASASAVLARRLRPVPSGLPFAAGAGPEPSDRLMRVLAEGLRSIAERRAQEQTERWDRAIIVPHTDGGTSDEPAPDP